MARIGTVEGLRGLFSARTSFLLRPRPDDGTAVVARKIPATARRDDIQGLRAIGVFLVAVYHIWVGRVSGGVDVFFIVSGYLLIGSLGRQAESTHRVDLVVFATRLARRLLPASLSVIAIIAISAPFWLPKMRWETVIHQLAASAVYVENWYLAEAAIDYLARDQVGSPLQHYWALSAQVQSLLILAAGLAAFTLIRRRPSRTDILAFLMSVFALSLAYSIYSTATNQTFAYFDTFARIWEFALGGITALLLPKIKLTPMQRTIGGWVGLAAILSCGILLEVSTVFPGYAALWPTLAAAAILVCGDGPPLRFGVARLLGARPLTWLGGISYSLYLWHWPILVFYLTLSYQTSAGVVGGIVVMLVSVLLSYLTTQFVEARFSTPRQGERKLRTVFGTAGALAAIGAVLSIWNAQAGRLMAEERLRIADVEHYPGAAAITGHAVFSSDIPVNPGPMTARWDDADVYRQGCHQSLPGDTLLSCSFGPKDATHVLALVGGSHSVHWLPALQSALGRYPDWRIVTYTKSSCVLSSRPTSEAPEYQRACTRWNERLMARLVTDKPDLVFTTSTRVVDGIEETPVGYREQWQTLAAAGLHIIAVRDTPWFGFDIPECVEINGRFSPKCAVQRDRVLSPVSPTSAVPPDDHLHFLDFTDFFCTGQTCPPVIGNVLVYYDKHHVTATYMRTLSTELRTQLAPFIDGASLAQK
ncbi:MAG: acyltransferase [Mesorhizobium sp.]|uniref:acyltransferase family protein n=1 Tax=Mesorhizobium sp. TaxID=1871066 RepID=UPI0011FF9F36|nr:acyltransferase family protein [Mesorhizobium sp.]TIS54539.1 MAG: acyltransferase [Mesorhizobium sp.]